MTSDKGFFKTGDVKPWLRTIRSIFFSIPFLIKKGYPFRFVIYQFVELLNIALIYPFFRILLGKKKSFVICDSFKEAFVPSGILSLPKPLQSRIMIPKHTTLYYSSFFEIYIKDIYSMETLKEKMNVIDIGANIGAYSILAAEKVGKKGRVVAVEPEPRNYQYLVENIKLNNFQNIIPQELALADYNGPGRLYLHLSSLEHSLVLKEDENSFLEITVKTLDDLLEGLNLERVDLIKIDAQGAEPSILKGATKTLKANPDIKLIIAAGEHSLEGQEKVFQFLNDKGFRVRIVEPGLVTNI